jgi:hypothetical protein
MAGGKKNGSNQESRAGGDKSGRINAATSASEHECNESINRERAYGSQGQRDTIRDRRRVPFLIEEPKRCQGRCFDQGGEKGGGSG